MATLISEISRRIDDITDQGRAATAASYRTCLISLRRFLADKPDPEITAIDNKFAENYALWLKNSGYKGTTIRYYHKIFRALVSTVADVHLSPINIGRTPQPLELTQIKTIAQATIDDNLLAKVRDKAISIILDETEDDSENFNNLLRALSYSLRLQQIITTEVLTDTADKIADDFPDKSPDELRAIFLDKVPAWYAVKIFSRAGADTIQEIINQYDPAIEIFIPEIKIARRTEKGVKEKTDTALRQFLFFRSTSRQSIEIKTNIGNRAMVYCNPGDLSRRPTPIPDRQIAMFRLILSSGEDRIDIYTQDIETLTQGDTVRILYGPFAGLEGTIRRIRKDRRVIIAITGLCAIALPHIPLEFLARLK
ncbi:MAG: phage integrase SAM-like domain-containing protein [Muribaculaceae bacterium]